MSLKGTLDFQGLEGGAGCRKLHEGKGGRRPSVSGGGDGELPVKRRTSQNTQENGPEYVDFPI